MKTTFKVWVTKYALTFGIQEKEVTMSLASDSMVSTLGSYKENYHGEGREWHRTKESAISKAEEMKIKKIQSLERTIKRISYLKFE